MVHLLAKLSKRTQAAFIKDIPDSARRWTVHIAPYCRAPDPALDPLWISYREPFHGAAKKDFGFQVTVKVAPGE